MSEVLAVENVGFSYPKRQALCDVSFTIAKGERVALVGPNGAGKTTLFLILTGVLEGYDGKVSVAGKSPGTRSQNGEPHSEVGIVFQNTEDQLFHTTVFEDVAFGPLNQGRSKDDVHERVHRVLREVGLDASLEREFPLHLSGGQRRRVALAGVLAMEPKILLLDEPSSDLDPRGRRELVALLNDLPITKIVSSHNLDFVAQTCDRVLVLNGGALVADGPAPEILSNEVLMLEHGLEVPGFYAKST